MNFKDYEDKTREELIELLLEKDAEIKNLELELAERIAKNEKLREKLAKLEKKSEETGDETEDESEEESED